MRILLLVPFGLLILGCSRTTNNETKKDDTLSQARDQSAVPFKYKSFFKLNNQKKFSFAYEDIERLTLTRIDSMQMKDLLRDDELLSYNRSSYDHYFFSYQSNHPGFQAITILMNIDYYYAIYYLTYSNDGDLVSRFEVAGSGGDGYYLTESQGHFINDSTFIYRAISKVFSDDHGSISKIDSVRQRIVINPMGVAQAV